MGSESKFLTTSKAPRLPRSPMQAMNKVIYFHILICASRIRKNPLFCLTSFLYVQERT
jgi:hypothetical protein